MPTNEQRRKNAKRKLERQIERRQERARQRRRTLTIASIVGVVVVLAGVLGTYYALSGSATPDAPAAQAAGACTYAPEGRASKPATPPEANPPRTGTVALTLATSQGAIPLTLDRPSAPCAVNAVASLAQQGFYDDTPCHRLTTGESLKVLQCGDPSGQGNGGAGFAYAQEPLPPGAGYGRGSIAMANTGQPDSTGSQFFLVYGAAQLPPDYSLVGTIGAPGLAVLDKVAAAGDDGSNGQPGDGKPKLGVQIQRATLGPPAP